MPKKEFEIGEEFQHGLTTLKCVEATDINNICKGCVFSNIDSMCRCLADKTIGPCGGLARKDGKSVIFIKVEK